MQLIDSFETRKMLSGGKWNAARVLKWGSRFRCIVKWPRMPQKFDFITQMLRDGKQNLNGPVSRRSPLRLGPRRAWCAMWLHPFVTRIVIVQNILRFPMSPRRLWFIRKPNSEPMTVTRFELWRCFSLPFRFDFYYQINKKKKSKFLMFDYW